MMENRLEDGWEPHVDGTYVSGIGEVFERRRDAAIEIALRTDARHVNLSGIVHGSIVMTLIDRAIGLNCRAVADGDSMTTATLTVNFLRHIAVGDFVSVTCRLRKKGRKAFFCDADAWVGDRLVATATGMCMKVG
jgi:uncharacterized protein (TIGR00369 family)